MGSAHSTYQLRNSNPKLGLTMYQIIVRDHWSDTYSTIVIEYDDHPKLNHHYSGMKRHINPDGTTGGWISRNTVVTNSHIDPECVINSYCVANSSIKGQVLANWDIVDSTIEGQWELCGTVSNSHITGSGLTGAVRHSVLEGPNIKTNYEAIRNSLVFGPVDINTYISNKIINAGLKLTYAHDQLLAHNQEITTELIANWPAIQLERRAEGHKAKDLPGTWIHVMRTAALKHISLLVNQVRAHNLITGEICVSSFDKNKVLGTEKKWVGIVYEGTVSYYFDVDCWSERIDQTPYRRSTKLEACNAGHDEGWLVPSQAKVLKLVTWGYSARERRALSRELAIDVEESVHPYKIVEELVPVKVDDTNTELMRMMKSKLRWLNLQVKDSQVHIPASKVREVADWSPDEMTYHLSPSQFMAKPKSKIL